MLALRMSYLTYQKQRNEKKKLQKEYRSFDDFYSERKGSFYVWWIFDWFWFLRAFAFRANITTATITNTTMMTTTTMNVAKIPENAKWMAPMQMHKLAIHSQSLTLLRAPARLGVCVCVDIGIFHIFHCSVKIHCWNCSRRWYVCFR